MRKDHSCVFDSNTSLYNIKQNLWWNSRQKFLLLQGQQKKQMHLSLPPKTPSPTRHLGVSKRRHGNLPPDPLPGNLWVFRFSAPTPRMEAEKIRSLEKGKNINTKPIHFGVPCENSLGGVVLFFSLGDIFCWYLASDGLQPGIWYTFKTKKNSTWKKNHRK